MCSWWKAEDFSIKACVRRLVGVCSPKETFCSGKAGRCITDTREAGMISHLFVPQREKGGCRLSLHWKPFNGA